MVQPIHLDSLEQNLVNYSKVARSTTRLELINSVLHSVILMEMRLISVVLELHGRRKTNLGKITRSPSNVSASFRLKS